MRSAFSTLVVCLFAATLSAAATNTTFVPITPCRLVDTRNASGPFGGPALTANGTRTVSVPSSPCGVPAASAYSLNVTIVNYDGSGGWITLFPTGSFRPFVSTVNFGAGPAVANAAIVAANDSGSFDVYASASTHVIIDINGYFVGSSGGTITSVTAGTGLTGGGSSGAISLGIEFAGSGVSQYPAHSDHKHYERTIIVSPSGGAAAVQAAVNGITDASASKQYLVHVEPGTYDLTLGYLQMKPYVDVEGSGEGVTRIRVASTVSVVGLADNSELRSITLEHYGAGGPDGPHSGGALAVLAQSGGAPRLRNVTLIATATASGATGASLGSADAVFTDVTILVNAGAGSTYGISGTGRLTLDRVNITVTGADNAYGVRMNDASSVSSNLIASRCNISVQSTTATATVNAITMTNAAGSNGTASVSETQASASAANGATVSAMELNNVNGTVTGSTVTASVGRGVLVSGTGTHTVTIENSRVAGPTNTVSATSSKTIRIAGTRLDGGAVAATSPVCAFVWDEGFLGYANSCP